MEEIEHLKISIFSYSVCPVPMLDDVGTNELPDLVDVFVNEEKSPTSSPLNGTSAAVTSEPGKDLKIRVVFKDKDDKSPIGKITLTTENVESIVFITTNPENIKDERTKVAFDLILI
jgi:hypothetical protein